MKTSISVKSVNKIVSVLVILACLRIDSVFYLTSFGNIYQELPTIMGAFLLVEFLLRFKRVSPAGKAIFWFYCFMVGVTLFNNGKIHTTLLTISPSFTMCLLCEKNMRKNPSGFISLVGKVLAVFVVLDFVTMFIYPNGMYATSVYSDNWLLGYKTARINISLPMIALLAADSIIKKNTISTFVWVMSVVALFAAIKSGATAGYLAIMIMVLLLATVFVFPSRKIQTALFHVMNAKIILPVITVLNIVIAVMQNIAFFEPIIVGLLDKNMTLTGRTYIWEVCMLLILEKPLCGHGYIDATSFVQLVGIGGGGTQPHNLILSLMVYTGIIGMSFFVYALLKALSQVNTDTPNETNPISFCIIATMSLGITSMNTFAAFTMASFIILWWCGKNVNSRMMG